MAAAQTITGSLGGTVSDATGSRLPGVTVTASSPELISRQEVRVSGEQGAYRFPALPPGTYALTFELQGFQTSRHEQVVLLAGQSLTVDAQLEISNVRESVTVSRQAQLIDTRSAALSNTADFTTLQNIPLGRNFTSALNTIPGVSHEGVVHGGTVRQNVYNLDGVNTNDPNTNTPVTELPTDAFQELQVTTAGIPAEFGNGSGGVFNYITRSGSNRFSGAASFFFQGRRLQSDNRSDALRGPGGLERGGLQHNYDGSGVLGGPVQRNRVWFFTTLRHVDQVDRTGSFSGPIEFTDTQFFSKGTVQVSKSNKAEVSFYYRDDYGFPANPSFRNSGDPSTWFGLDQHDQFIMPRWTSVLGPNIVFEARASVGYDGVRRITPNYAGSPIYQDQATGILRGGDIQGNSFNGRDRYQAKADLSYFKDRWLAGSHNFKVGFGWEKAPSLDERLLIFARGPNELDEGCSDRSRCLSPTPDTLHILMNSQPFRVRLVHTPRYPKYETGNWTFYGQDQWVLRERYTFSLGLRLEHQYGRLPESRVGGGQWEPDITVFPDQDLFDLTTLAPRLGFTWDVDGRHQSIVKASYGRFYYQISNFQISNASAAAQQAFRDFDWIDRNRDLIYQPGEEGQLRADTRPNLDFLPTVDPNLKDQYNDVYTIGFERTLPAAWTFAATGIFKREGDLLGTVDALIPFSSYDAITVTNPVTNQPMTIHTLRREFQGRQGQIVLTNPGQRPGDPVKLERKYRGLELVLRRRLRGRFQVETSYVLGQGEGNVGNAFSESNFFFYTNPNNLVNGYGDLQLGPRHHLKIHGLYRAPFGLLFSGFFQTQSGVSWAAAPNPQTVKGAATGRFFRTTYPQIQSESFIDVAVETSGTRKFEPLTRLDVRMEKRVPVHVGDIGLALDVFNLLNAGTVTSVQELRFDATNFGVPGSIQSPRQIRLTLRWNF